jgi:hypothetical protein
MREHSDFISSGAFFPSQIGEMVSVFVHYDHPLLELKRNLDWEQLEALMVRHWHTAGKNVAGGRGLSFPVSFYARLLVLKTVKALNSRQMEEYLSESVVARLFMEVQAETFRYQLKDHSSIARAEQALGKTGYREVNQWIVGEAVRLGFARLDVLSSDTTVQTPEIGYPTEAGILRMVAQRVGRALKKLKQKGYEQAESALEQVAGVLKKVKHYHLFTKDQESKNETLKQIVEQSEQMIKGCVEIVGQVAGATNRAVISASEKLKQMAQFTDELMPQVRSWMETGKVATEKLLHPGITGARGIVKNKAGKKTEFGLKWLINRLLGGYVFGKVVAARADERKMPLESLALYREIFGHQATPEMSVYDRGGSDATTIKKLESEKIKKIGIQPKGQAEWLIAEEDQKEAMSHRGKTEGVIGTLKSQKYEFKQGRQRTNQSLEAAGHRSLLGMNLNKLVRDIMEKKKELLKAVEV